MRRASLLAALPMLVVSACGGGDGSPVPESTSAAAESTTVPSTTSPSTTTTAPSTTTRPPTTTTTVPPWTTLPEPDPALPMLSSALGGPVEVGTICLQVGTEGLLAYERAVEVVEFLGVGVSREAQDCQATLELSLTGGRSAAMYSIWGARNRCWSGIEVVGETTLVVGETVQKTWTVDYSQSPPSQISHCPDEHEVIPDRAWACEALGVPLAEMFGSVGYLAVAFASWSADDDAWCGEWLGVPSDEEIRRLISLLLERDESKTAFVQEWVEQVGVSTGEWAAFMPVVPYLIALLDEPSCSSDAQAALLDIGSNLGTGWYEAAENWWLWWEHQQG